MNQRVKIETADDRRQQSLSNLVRQNHLCCCLPPVVLVRLTPPGRGAVATFFLCGNDAAKIFLPHWRGQKTLGKHPCWGRLQLNDAGDCEEAIACQTDGGAIEIHVHGGEQIASAIESLFLRHGAVRKTWQEHFAAGTSQQELALRLLPFAPTERTAQILLDQYHGAYNREISAIDELTNPEERQRRMARLQKRAEVGKHLVEPYRVVLAGASNAGKSSLLNAILGFQRSIVHAIPGTTRDVVSGQTAVDGFPVTFFDTAGFRETGDNLELQGMDRSLRSLGDADLVVWVIDITAQERESVSPPVAQPLFCYNKIDLLQTTDGRRQTAVELAVSALTGEGIESLFAEVIRFLVPYPPQPGDAVPITHPAIDNILAGETALRKVPL